MDKNIPPCAAKGKFPYPHRDLKEVARADYAFRPEHESHVRFREWVRRYHG